MSTRTRRPTVFLVALLLLLAACSSGGTATTSDGGAATTTPAATTPTTDAATDTTVSDTTVSDTTAAAGAAGEFVDGVLQPLEDGFPNQPLTFMVIDTPGSTDSIYTTELIEAASALSPVELVLEHREDFTTFGTWEGITFLENDERGRDGYINYIIAIQGAVIDTLLIPPDELGGDLDSLNVALVSETVPYFLYQRADPEPEWGTTMEGMLEYARENPGTIQYISSGPGGAQDAAFKYWQSQLDFTVEEVVAGDTIERALVIAAGEGDIATAPPEVVLPHWEADKVDVLMAGGAVAPEPWSDVPTSESLGVASDPYGLTRGVALAPSVPEEHRAWLETLLRAAVEDPAFIEARQRVPGVQLHLMDNTEARAMAQDVYDFTFPIFKDLGLYWEDQ